MPSTIAPRSRSDGIVQPKIEPEIVFKLRRSPPADARPRRAAGVGRMARAGLRARAVPLPRLGLRRRPTRSPTPASTRATPSAAPTRRRSRTRSPARATTSRASAIELLLNGDGRGRGRRRARAREPAARARAPDRGAGRDCRAIRRSRPASSITIGHAHGGAAGRAGAGLDDAHQRPRGRAAGAAPDLTALRPRGTARGVPRAMIASAASSDAHTMATTA